MSCICILWARVEIRLSIWIEVSSLTLIKVYMDYHGTIKWSFGAYLKETGEFFRMVPGEY